MAIPEPLKRYLRAQVPYDVRIMGILEEAAKDIERRLAKMDLSRFSESVRANQFRLALAAIRREQLGMFLAIGDEIRAGQLAAATFALDDLERFARAAFAGLNARAADAFIDSLMQTAQAGIRTTYARTRRQLSEALYRNGQWSTDHIETLIRSAIARGASARELAKDVYKFVSPTAPGGASFVAMRLARTEINNAFHNQQISGFQGPWVQAVRWNLSGSHKRPDECNRLAQSDQYGLGPGRFPPGKVPGKPHPQCLCYLTADTVPPDKFAAEVKSGKFDDELRRRYELNRASAQLSPSPKKNVAPSVKSTRPPAAPKKATPAKSPTSPSPSKVNKPPTTVTPSGISDHLKRINKVEGEPGQRVAKSLANQAEFAPASMRRLNEVRKMSGRESVDFKARHGSDALGGYVSGDYRIVAQPEVFSAKYDRVFQKELKSGWSSRCGHQLSGAEAFIAHECGHHLDDIIRLRGPNNTKEIWETLAAELSLPKPLFFDKTGLDKYVSRHSAVLSKGVSKYGATQSDEIIAEIWAEYTTNPNARPHVKKIGRIIQRLSEEAAR